MASTRVVVLPVPGGPCTTITSLARSTSLTAVSCVGFSHGNRMGWKVSFPAGVAPWKISRSSAIRPCLAALTLSKASNINR